MGGSSSSSSTTSQTNTAINPIAFADNGSTSLNNVNGGNGTIVNNVTNMDSGLVAHLSDNNLTATQDALLFGSDQSHQAYGFAQHALDSSLTFADTSSARAFGFAGTANAAANATTAAAMSATGAAYQSALDSNIRQTGVALNALAGSASMIDTAYKDAKGVLGTNVIMVALGAGVLVIYFALRRH